MKSEQKALREAIEAGDVAAIAAALSAGADINYSHSLRCRTCYRQRHPRDRRTKKQREEDFARTAAQVSAEMELERRQNEVEQQRRSTERRTD